MQSAETFIHGKIINCVRGKGKLYVLNWSCNNKIKLYNLFLFTVKCSDTLLVCYFSEFWVQSNFLHPLYQSLCSFAPSENGRKNPANARIPHY